MSNQSVKGLKRLTDTSWAVKMTRKFPGLVIYSQRQYIYSSQKRCCDLITM